jgi:hypothetical protein
LQRDKIGIEILGSRRLKFATGTALDEMAR